MKKIVLFLLVLMPLFASAQNKYFNKNGLKELKSIVSLAKLAAGNSSLQLIAEAQSKFKIKVDSVIDINPFLRDNKDYISDLYLSMYSETGANNFKFNKTSWCPTIVNYNTGNVLIFHEIIYTSIFNNRVLDERARAKEIVKDVANLIYQRISDKVDNKIQYIGLCIAYGAKDFSEKYESPKGDCLVVIAPVSAIKNFGECQLSEDEFCKKCDYFMSDQKEFIGLKKIELNVFDGIK